MKKHLFLITFFISIVSFAAKTTISTSGSVFSPSNVEINLGDTILFNVGSGHTATEVSQSTWNANGTTPNGIFNFGEGSNQQVVNLSLGTHYYVCVNHVGMGMKGTITVNLSSGIKNKTTGTDVFNIFPNPAKEYLMLQSNGIPINRITITDIEGKVIKEMIPDKNTDKVSIAALPGGMYLLSVYTKENEVYLRKFVKE